MQITDCGQENVHPLLQKCSHHFTAVVLGAFCLTIWGLMFPLVLFASAQEEGLIPPPPSVESFRPIEPVSPPPDNRLEPIGGPNENNNNNDIKQNNDIQKQQQERESQQLKMMQRGVSGMEQGVKSFQKQIDRLTKQGLIIPADVTASLDKIKTAITSAKSATTLDDAQSAMSDIQDEMQSLQDSRQTLDKLARWPQTIKQIDNQIKQLNRSLKQDQSLSARLTKQGFDISDLVTKFQSDIAELQSVRDRAKSELSSDPETAFDTLQNDFFDKMDDVQQSHQIIQTIGNLGRFSSEYKRGISQAGSVIKSLKNQKIDTANLEDILATVKEKGAAVQSLLQTKPIDPEAVQSALEDLGAAKQEFENAKADLMPDSGQSVPWQQPGTSQFNIKGFNTGALSQLLPQSNLPAGGDIQPPVGMDSRMLQQF